LSETSTMASTVGRPVERSMCRGLCDQFTPAEAGVIRSPQSADAAPEVGEWLLAESHVALAGATKSGSPREVERFQHPSWGVIELNCQSLLDPDQSYLLLVHTAVPGSESYYKLPLLSVIGSQPLTVGGAPPSHYDRKLGSDPDPRSG
jgi:hypothetical protein